MFLKQEGKTPVIKIVLILLFIILISEGAIIYYYYTQIEDRDNKIANLNTIQEKKENKLREAEGLVDIVEGEIEQEKDILMSDKFAGQNKIKNYIQTKINENKTTNANTPVSFGTFLKTLSVDENPYFTKPTWRELIELDQTDSPISWQETLVHDWQNNLIRLRGTIPLTFGNIQPQNEILPDGYILEGVARIKIYIDLTTQNEFDTFMENFEAELTTNNIPFTLLTYIGDESSGAGWFRNVYEINIPGRNPLWIDIGKDLIENNSNIDADIDIVFDKGNVLVNLEDETPNE